MHIAATLHPAVGDIVMSLIGVCLIALLLPMAVHALLDTWGDRHTALRGGLLAVAGALPLLGAGACAILLL